MSSALMFPYKLRAGNLLEATSQRGQKPNYFQPGAANLGTFAPEPRGSGYVQALLTIVDSGGPQVATAKLSLDGGVTQLGRKAHSTWDGNGATARTIYDGAAGVTAPVHVGAVIAADLDGDGAEDTLFVPIVLQSAIAGGCAIYKSDDLSGTGTWTLHATLPDQKFYSICYHPGRKYFYGLSFVGGDSGDGYATVYISGNAATWYYLSSVGPNPTQVIVPGNIIPLLSGSLAISYSYTVGGYGVVVARTSVWGTEWGAERIYSGASVNLTQPFIHQLNTGEVIMAFLRNTSPVGARLVWFANLEGSTAAPTVKTAMFADDSTHSFPSVTVAPDRTIYYAVNSSFNSKIQFSSVYGDDSTLPAVSTLRDPADALAKARLSLVGGALFCVAINSTLNNVELVMTKYWTTYDTGAPNPSWTGWMRQWLSGEVWAALQGGTAVSGDTFALITGADFGAHRIGLGYTSRPARSVADNLEWEAVFDAGSYKNINVDTICVWGNFHHLHAQLNDSNVWTGPTVNAEVNHVRRTIAAAHCTVSGGKITIAGDALQPHHHHGELIRFAGTGGIFPITDNSENMIWSDGYNMTGNTGDVQILSRRRWVSITPASLRCLRYLIEQQHANPDDQFFELCASVGLRTEAIGGLIDCNPPMTDIIATDYETRSGSLIRSIDGPPRRAWELGLYRVGADKFLEIKRQILAYGSAPFVLIPDVTDPYDWAYVLCDTRIKEDPGTTVLKLVEVT